MVDYWLEFHFFFIDFNLPLLLGIAKGRKTWILGFGFWKGNLRTTHIR